MSEPSTDPGICGCSIVLVICVTKQRAFSSLRRTKETSHAMPPSESKASAYMPRTRRFIAAGEVGSRSFVGWKVRVLPSRLVTVTGFSWRGSSTATSQRLGVHRLLEKLRALVGLVEIGCYRLRDAHLLRECRVVRRCGHGASLLRRGRGHCASSGASAPPRPLPRRRTRGPASQSAPGELRWRTRRGEAGSARR